MLIKVGGHRGSSETMYAEIDDEDFDKVKDIKFSIKSAPYTYYAFSILHGLLHRIIMDLKSDDKRLIDHKDGNGLNNKKENLVICDKMYNSQSFRCHGDNKGIGCVYLRKDGVTKPYRAKIKIMGKEYIKCFESEQEGHEWIKSLVEVHLNL
jgi:hypothetical protein